MTRVTHYRYLQNFMFIWNRPRFRRKANLNGTEMSDESDPTCRTSGCPKWTCSDRDESGSELAEAIRPSHSSLISTRAGRTHTDGSNQSPSGSEVPGPKGDGSEVLEAKCSPLMETRKHNWPDEIRVTSEPSGSFWFWTPAPARFSFHSLLRSSLLENRTSGPVSSKFCWEEQSRDLKKLN